MKSIYVQYCIVVLFVLLTSLIVAWSWVLVDPNFTLIKHADWTSFRESAISIGYFQRQWSANIYALLILTITLSSIVIVRLYRGPVLPLLVLIGIIAGLFSYPALSHDLFNYIFDARIVTHYHANPYLHTALDFPTDRMLRFMHWVHRTYPYGPTYLPISLVPSYLGFGIFSLTFILFKVLHVVLYVIAGWSLSTMNNKAALLFITSPLIIVEGLINTHNDFVALSLAIIGVSLLQSKRTYSALVAFVISGFIKFISLPSIILGMGDYIPKRLRLHFQPWHLALGGISVLLLYLLTHQEIQPWYFLNLFVFLPFAPNIFEKFSIAITGLLLSYYPYVLGGEWGQGGDVGMKRSIIVYSLVLNMIVIFFTVVLRNRNTVNHSK